MQTSQIRRSTRILSALVDHLLMTIIAVMLSIPYFVISTLSSLSENSHSDPSALFSKKDIIGPYWYLGLIGFAVYFCKDSIQGRSIAKRIFNLQVVVNSTNQQADPLRCLVRNLLILLWPIEIILCLVNPERRIGDYIAGTKIIVYTNSAPPISHNVPKILVALVLAYLFCLLPMLYIIK